MKLMYFLTHITNSGGMEHIVIDKINYFAENGYEIALAYFGKETDEPFFPLSANVKKYPIDLFLDTSSLYIKGINFIKLISRLNGIIKRFSPDVIVNANAITISWILPFLKRNIPKIVELHFSYDGLMEMNKEYYGNNKFKCYINNKLRTTIYPKYHYCVLLTDTDKKKWGFRNAVVIPNFTNMHGISRNEHSAKNVICVGRLDPPKNIDLLVKSWKIVASAEPVWHLDIWGDGVLRTQIESLIVKLDLQDFVTLKGTSKKLDEEYPKYSLFVLPSRYEGFPLVLVEAMEYGLPCVGFDISGNIAVIEDGKNGIIVKKRTPEDLATAILSLIQSPSLRKKMSVYAANSIKKYSKENVMQMWTDLFNDMVRV